MTRRAALGLALVFLATLAATLAFLAYREPAMGLVLEVWRLCA